MVPGFQPHGVERRFEAKMPQTMFEFKAFALAIGQQSGKETSSLRSGRFGGGFAHGHILFEGLMVFLHFSASVIDCSESDLRQGGVAANQV